LTDTETYATMGGWDGNFDTVREDTFMETYEEAIEQVRELEEIDAHHQPADSPVGRIYARAVKIAEALHDAEKSRKIILPLRHKRGEGRQTDVLGHEFDTDSDFGGGSRDGDGSPGWSDTGGPFGSEEDNGGPASPGGPLQ